MAAIYDENNNYVGDDGLDERDAEAEGGLTADTYDGGVYTDPTTGEKIDFNSLFNPFGGNTSFGKGLASAKDLLSGKSSLGMAGQLAGLGGIGALINQLMGSNSGGFAGYKGGIPQYTATRTMNEIPQTVSVPVTKENPTGIAARRPGSGGITYFTPMTYAQVPAAAAPVTPAATVTEAKTDTVVEKAGGGMLYASGGIANLGGYSDGGQLLRGPGDGVSDDIPATIGGRQPARLADGEFVIPARIVSELGNGSTDAGARKLYAMMDRIKKTRSKAKNIAANTKAYKHLPA